VLVSLRRNCRRGNFLKQYFLAAPFPARYQRMEENVRTKQK
jgi:hypothetical protein